MKILAQKANLIPVIAKSDGMTAEEKIFFKQRASSRSISPLILAMMTASNQYMIDLANFGKTQYPNFSQHLSIRQGKH